MKPFTRRLVPALIAVLLLSGLLLVSAEPVLAKTKFFFGLNVGVPIAPYPMYAYPPPAPVYYPQAYPHPAPARVHHRPVYRAYPPCAQVWTPGYYDPYGNWIFGYPGMLVPPMGTSRAGQARQIRNDKPPERRAAAGPLAFSARF